MNFANKSQPILAGLPLIVSTFLPTTMGAQRTAATPRLPIVPLTTVGPENRGYMADPQPVRLAAQSDPHQLFISGTTRAVISGTFPLKPSSLAWTPIEVNPGALRGAIQVAGGHVTNIQNTDVFQDDHQGWHAAITIGLSSQAHPEHWTVIAHAKPVGPVSNDSVPTSWYADTLLSGSLTDAVNGNYDGKYYEEDGRLYLLYVKGTAPAPALRNAIVLQAMTDPVTVAASAPVTLLTPGDRFGALNSERYANTQARLVEAPYITRVGGKYALVYSTGAYLTDGYKTAVAWSDTLMPPSNEHYRKVLMQDTQGVWQEPDRRDVRYLLQSQKPAWPDYSGAEVIGPGVAAAVEGPGGAYWLIFNGFAPNDRPRLPGGQVDGTHRRPFGMRLRVSVPEGVRLSDVTDEQLASWMRPL